MSRAGSIRSGAQSAGHHASASIAAPVPPSPNGNGDAVMPPTITTTGAVPELRPIGPSTQAHVLELVAFDGHRRPLDNQAAGNQNGVRYRGHQKTLQISIRVRSRKTLDFPLGDKAVK